MSGRDGMDRNSITDKHQFLDLKLLRHLASALLVVFLLVAMFLTSVPMLGHAKGSEEKVLYEENFDDGQAQGWKLEEGWVVDAGMLHGKEHVWARYAEGHWGEERVTLRFSLISLQGTMHANVRVSDMGRYAIGFRYMEHRFEEEELHIYLFKQMGPDEFSPTLAKNTILYDPSWNIVEIVTEGGKIQVYLHGADQEFQPYLYKAGQEVAPSAVPLIDYVDPVPLPPGSIAFETLEDTVAQIDDIVIIGIPVPPPPTPPPTSTEPEPEGPDFIISATNYEFENDERVLALSVEITNQGNARTPETLVNSWDQDYEFPERTSPIPGLSPGETTSLEIRQELTKEHGGGKYLFLFEVDPNREIPELNEENNQQTIVVSVPPREGGIPWYWIIPVLLVGGGMGFLVKRWSNIRRTNMLKKIQLRPQKGIGNQQIESATPIRLDYEIRLKPVLDHGKQDIKVKGSLITNKRRQT